MTPLEEKAKNVFGELGDLVAEGLGDRQYEFVLQTAIELAKVSVHAGMMVGGLKALSVRDEIELGADPSAA